jgi:hypothetical protein
MATQVLQNQIGTDVMETRRRPMRLVSVGEPTRRCSRRPSRRVSTSRWSERAGCLGPGGGGVAGVAGTLNVKRRCSGRRLLPLDHTLLCYGLFSPRGVRSGEGHGLDGSNFFGVASYSIRVRLRPILSFLCERRRGVLQNWERVIFYFSPFSKLFLQMNLKLFLNLDPKRNAPTFLTL